MFSPASEKRIPDDVLKKIVDNSDFQSIQILRKTCCDLRNFIDDVQLDTHVTKIHITVKSESVFMKLSLNDEIDKNFELGYQKQHNNCSVARYNPEKKTSKFIRNADFLDAFCGDLGVILRQQSNILKAFCLTFENYNFENQHNGMKTMELIVIKIIDGLERILESRKTPLKVKEFEIELIDESRIASILSSIDARTLEKIVLASAELKARAPFQAGALKELDQWRHARELEIYQFVVLAPADSFIHFEKVNIILEKVSEMDLMFLKQSFLHYSRLKSFKLHSKSLNSTLDLSEVFGQSYDDIDRNGSQRRRWFYNIPISDNEVLMIHYDFYSCIHFSIVNLSEVPRNAFVELN